MVNLIVKSTPVLSSLISLRTSEEGVFVGKGPSVSDGLTVQSPVVVVPPVVSVVSGVVTSSFEHAKGTMLARPKTARPFLKKSFLSIVVVLM